jgi:lipid II:glycine glycyltransferase (peptidoglycan interpeptide bridge formation enzyme)
MDITLHNSPPPEYDAWVQKHPEGSLWQSSQWATYQRSLGRETRFYLLREANQILASALVIVDSTTGGFSTWDIPRGPLSRDMGQGATEMLLQRITDDAKNDRCIALFCSPKKPLVPCPLSLVPSSRLEQPSQTRIIDLTQSEEEILAGMKQKGRYNIAVAKRHGVTVEQSRDISAFGKIMKETAARDGFTPAGATRYAKFLECVPGSFLLLAYTSNKPIAGLLGVVWNKQGIYYYGASSYVHRALMAPFSLQWEAMRFCKAQGCSSYDLFGIAPADKATTHHPWTGITRFKENFGGEVSTYPPEQMIVLKPWAYWALRVKRRIFG